MTTIVDTIPGLEQALERAYSDEAASQTPEVDINAALGYWAYGFGDRLWRRWDCESDHCPGEPEWCKVLSDAIDPLPAAIEEEVVALVRRRLAEFAETFQAEHPEAVLRAD